ncbi:MAG: polysaccharide pyruvyl transferase family protein [Cytophagales bacterium]|nr:polysaccharide pyruvyl transferase family protein [Cytophagales bacterium]
MKIGIVTFHNVYNYGGMLQAYALSKYLNKSGSYTAECIDYRQPALTEKYTHKLYDNKKSLTENIKHFVSYYILRRNYQKEQKFDQFLKQNIKLSDRVYNIEDLQSLADEYKVLVSGSDQLWNPEFTGGDLDQVFFLDVKFSGLKLAYASSAGAYQFNERESLKLKKYFSGYDRIAVREEYLRDQLQSIQEDIQVGLDPTLLLNKMEWNEIARDIQEDCPSEFILLYTFNNDQRTLAIADRVREVLGLPIVSLFRVKTSVNIDYTFDNLGPEEFLGLLNKASFVVSNSFHGTAFAVNFNKDFFSVYKKSNPYRVMNLLDRVGLRDRLVDDVNSLPESIKWKMDFKNPNSMLSVLRKEAEKFLNLENEVTVEK